jgi:hypothetical protein
MPRVVVHLRRRDLLRAQFQMLRRKRIFAMLFIAMLAVSAWDLHRFGSLPGNYAVAALVLTPTLIVAVAILASFAIIAPLMLVRLGRTRGVLGEHAFEITDQGLREITEAGETRVAWGAARRVFRTRAFLFAVIHSRGIFLFPRRAFANASAYDEFWNALQPLARKKNSQ